MPKEQTAVSISAWSAQVSAHIALAELVRPIDGHRTVRSVVHSGIMNPIVIPLMMGVRSFCISSSYASAPGNGIRTRFVAGQRRLSL